MTKILKIGRVALAVLIGLILAAVVILSAISGLMNFREFLNRNTMWVIHIGIIIQLQKLWIDT